ncbi:MAG TPA: hypothetical protein VEM13_08650 [Gemmatimonadales bacterium]|nr:hypothetical protein [Gemmatimonadales bacterium]
MKAQLHWARLKAEAPYPLRRGAWYRVTTRTASDFVLDVNRKPVHVPQSLLELVAGRPPRRWSVVRRPAKAVRLPDSWGDHYAVCPSCRHRAPLHGSPHTLRCPRCNGLFFVAWDELYLAEDG